MSALRDEIRAILREEIAALHDEGRRAVEVVNITASADLDRFARALLARAADPNFVRAVNSGAHRFELSGAVPAANSGPPDSGRPKPEAKATLEFSKSLVTERDINALGEGIRHLRVSKTCRITPLASDETRRRGIRIERFTA